MSLLIKDSLEGDMIDNLSGSVFHHYCSPPVCKDCRSHPQEVSKVVHTCTPLVAALVLSYFEPLALSFPLLNSSWVFFSIIIKTLISSYSEVLI